MEVIYILKPDLLANKEALAVYSDFIQDNGLLLSDEIEIDDWTLLSKYLYEPRNQDSLGLKKSRSQLITTIKGYQIMYPENFAVALFYKADVDSLRSLYDFKKELRKEFVYDSDRVFLRFHDKLPLEKKLIDIDIDNLDCDIKVVPVSVPFEDSSYQMSFLNMLHFPDPNVSDIGRDIQLVKSFRRKVK